MTPVDPVLEDAFIAAVKSVSEFYATVPVHWSIPAAKVPAWMKRRWRNVARERGRAASRVPTRRTDFGARWASQRPHVTLYRPFLSRLICTAPGYNATVTL